MKLFLLRLNEYDINLGFVIRAKCEEHARQIAGENCGDEGENVWLSKLHSTCEQLKATGRAGVILRDYNNG